MNRNDDPENFPYRYWPDGLTEADVDALMAEAGIDDQEDSPDVEPSQGTVLPFPTRPSEPDSPPGPAAA